MSELDLRNMMRLTCPMDKKISMTLGVFQGHGGISVFMQDNPKPLFRTTLSNRRDTGIIVQLLQKLLTAGPDTKYTISVTEWDREAKKAVSTGSLILGRDDKNIPYIGVSGAGMPQSYKFPFYGSLRFDTSTEDAFSPEDQTRAAITAMQDFLRFDLHQAQLLTSHPREFKQRSQGNTYKPGDQIPY